MNYKKAVGFGILEWLIMFAVVSATLSLYQFLWMKIVLAVIAGIVAYILAGYVEIQSAKRALGYGLIWVIIGLALDVLITTQFNPAIFTLWPLWLGYALMLIAPFLRIKKAAPAGPQVSQI